jgi:hypothetical protein
MVMQFFSVIG